VVYALQWHRYHSVYTAGGHKVMIYQRKKREERGGEWLQGDYSVPAPVNQLCCSRCRLLLSSHHRPPCRQIHKQHKHIKDMNDSIWAPQAHRRPGHSIGQARNQRPSRTCTTNRSEGRTVRPGDEEDCQTAPVGCGTLDTYLLKTASCGSRGRHHV